MVFSSGRPPTLPHRCVRKGERVGTSSMVDIAGQKHPVSQNVMTGSVMKTLMKVKEVEGSRGTVTIEFKSA